MERIPRKPTIGYKLFENDSIVMIATLKSGNRKTGAKNAGPEDNMVQTWILPRHIKPTRACRIGKNSLVCGDCKLRPKPYGSGSCYVNVGQAPQGIWKAYQRDRYAFLPTKEYARVFAGRTVRLGAYGDPAFIPYRILEKLTTAAAGHTGYTHQWHKCTPKLHNLVMASVDSIAEMDKAKAKGYRTFRIRPEDAPILRTEVNCPPISGKTHCTRCLLCSGTARPTAKDVSVPVHGSGKSNFQA